VNDLISSLTQNNITLIVALAVGLSWVAGKVRAAIGAAKEFVVHVVDERVPLVVKETIKATLGNGLKDMVTDVVGRAVDRHASEERENLTRAFAAEREARRREEGR